MRDILVVGGSGQVGRELKRYAWPAGWTPVALSRNELDLTDLAALSAVVAGRRWAAVINVAAFTAVDDAQSQIVAAWQVNGLAPAAFGAACQAAGVPLVHVSTDYVFDGTKPGAWQVDDVTNPLNVYGASKLGGELAVRSSGARHAIVRTSWVVSAHGRNFITTILRLSAERPTLQVVEDQHGSPTSATDLAAVLAQVAMRLTLDPDAPQGVFHFANSGSTTWADFARAILQGAAARGGSHAQVARIPSADYPTPARRPRNSTLDTTRIQRDYGLTPRSWREALNPILDEVVGRGS